MRVLVTGSRDWSDRGVIWRELDRLRWMRPTIVEGCATGADALAEAWCMANPGFKDEHHPAHWRHDRNCELPCKKVVGRAAGPIRNSEMLQMLPDFVLAFHENLDESKGTRDMVDKAKRKGLVVYHFDGIGVNIL